MSQLRDEIDKNHSAFFADWTTAHGNNLEALRVHPAFVSSYRRVTVLQALKTSILIPEYTSQSVEFFFEAHNDALVSHVSAAVGAWRPALQSLRSCIENILCAIYYNEHPVELSLWLQGKFIISSAELFKYMEKHPRISDVAPGQNAIEVLKSEYSTLSKAVHASAVNFRMTDAASNIALWNADSIRANQWSSREKQVISGLCMLIITKHRESVQGTKLTPLRDVLGFALSENDKKKLKTLSVSVA